MIHFHLDCGQGSCSHAALTWDEIGIKYTWPALRGVSRTLAAHREQKDTLAGADLDSRHITLRPVWPLRPALCSNQKRGEEAARGTKINHPGSTVMLHIWVYALLSALMGLYINKMYSYLLKSPVDKIHMSMNKRTGISLTWNNVLELHLLKPHYLNALKWLN